MRVHQILAALPLIALVTIPVFGEECRFESNHLRDIDTAGAVSISIEAGSGLLRVDGTTGDTALRAAGRACASSQDLLDDLDVTVERQGDRVIVRTHHPKTTGWGRSRYARVDLRVTLPDDIPLHIDDSSGSMTVRGVAAAEIEDSSGSINLRDIRGPVSIDDSSGSIEIAGVAGSVRIWDSSGSIGVEDVRGSVLIEDDSSGSISVHEVEGDVVVQHDSSGSISVTDVGGDFVVAHDGSGGISYRNVSGRVDVPGPR